MGIHEIGQMFDVTGTSEHLGVLQKEMDCNTTLVSGPYIEHMVHYGVTASSGSSIKYGLKLMQSMAADSDRKYILPEEADQAKDEATRMPEERFLELKRIVLWNKWHMLSWKGWFLVCTIFMKLWESRK